MKKPDSDRRRVSEAVLDEFGEEEIEHFDTIIIKESASKKLQEIVTDSGMNSLGIKVIKTPDSTFEGQKTKRGEPVDMVLVDSKKLCVPIQLFHFDFDGIKDSNQEIEVIQGPVVPEIETCEGECTGGYNDRK